MGVGFASSGSGGQDFAIKLEGDGDTKLGNSDGDLHQITGSVAMLFCKFGCFTLALVTLTIVQKLGRQMSVAKLISKYASILQ